MSYAAALNEAAKCDISFVPYENEKGMAETRSLVNSISAGNRVAVFIGPEGGFEDDEIEEARKLGIHAGKAHTQNGNGRNSFSFHACICIGMIFIYDEMYRHSADR